MRKSRGFIKFALLVFFLSGELLLSQGFGTTTNAFREKLPGDECNNLFGSCIEAPPG